MDTLNLVQALLGGELLQKLGIGFVQHQARTWIVVLVHVVGQATELDLLRSIVHRVLLRRCVEDQQRDDVAVPHGEHGGEHRRRPLHRRAVRIVQIGHLRMIVDHLTENECDRGEHGAYDGGPEQKLEPIDHALVEETSRGRHGRQTGLLGGDRVEDAVDVKGEEHQVRDGGQAGQQNEHDRHIGADALPDGEERIERLYAALGRVEDEQTDRGGEHHGDLHVVARDLRALAFVEQMLAGEHQPEAEQRTVEHALADVAEEVHERQIEEQRQVLDRQVELGDRASDHVQVLLDQIGRSVQLFDAQMKPEQRGQRDHEEDALHRQPDEREAAVLVDGDEVQILQGGARSTAARILADHTDVHQIVVIVDRLQFEQLARIAVVLGAWLAFSIAQTAAQTSLHQTLLCVDGPLVLPGLAGGQPHLHNQIALDLVTGVR